MYLFITHIVSIVHKIFFAIAVFAVLFITTTHHTQAVISGGNYSLNGSITSLSGGTAQEGGAYTLSSRADSVAGSLSGGVFSMSVSTPGTEGTTVTTPASGGSSSGAGGVIESATLTIESLSTKPTENGVTITVTFSDAVSGTLLYGEDALTHSSPQSTVSNTHTFTIANLTPDTEYSFAIDASLGTGVNTDTSFHFGDFVFTTRGALPETNAEVITLATTTTQTPLTPISQSPTKKAIWAPVTPYNPNTYDHDAAAPQGTPPHTKGSMQRVILSGVVKDTQYTPLSDFTLTLIDPNGGDSQIINITQTDSTGAYSMVIPNTGSYILYSNEPGYHPITKEITVNNESIFIESLVKASSQGGASGTFAQQTKTQSCTTIVPIFIFFLIGFSAVVIGVGKYLFPRGALQSLVWKYIFITTGVAWGVDILAYLTWCDYIHPIITSSILIN